MFQRYIPLVVHNGKVENQSNQLDQLEETLFTKVDIADSQRKIYWPLPIP